jgi:hypothetical protein
VYQRDKTMKRERSDVEAEDFVERLRKVYTDKQTAFVIIHKMM